MGYSHVSVLSTALWPNATDIGRKNIKLIEPTKYTENFFRVVVT